MQLRFLRSVFIVLAAALIIPPVAGAQELFIDEDGNAVVEWRGSVLGQSTEQTVQAGTALAGDDTSDADDTLHREEITNTSGSQKQVDVEDDHLRIRIRPPSSNETEDDEATGPAQRVESMRVAESRHKYDILIRKSDDGVEMTQNGVRVRTHFPITVGADNELIITTPAGTKVVTVLPDAALKNLIQKGFPVATSSAVQEEDTGTGSGLLSALDASEITLVEEDGMLVYTTKGRKTGKLLGLFPVAGAVQADVSAETGQIVHYNEPWIFRYFGFLIK